MVGAIIGWVFLSLLALVVLVMVLPTVITVEMREGVFSVWVRVLFVRLRVFPMKPRPAREPKAKKEPKKKKKPDEEDGKKKKEKPKKGFGEMVAFIKRLAAAGMRAMRVFFRHLRIRKVQLVLPVHAEDAADTALRCGQIQMAVGTARAVLDGRLNIRYKRLEILPDFAGQLSKALYFSCKVCFSPGIIFVMGAAFLKRYLQKRPYSKKVYKRAIAEKRARAQQRAAQNGKDAA